MHTSLSLAQSRSRSMKLYVAIILLCILPSVHGQLDSQGFISIDCGSPLNSSYQDPKTTITYVSDYGFVSTGENRKVSSDYINPSLAPYNYDLRLFPHGDRSCYNLRSLVAGNKYLLHAIFYYGNYDGLGKPPVFDLYMGTNYWHEVNFRDATTVTWMDIIVVAPADYLQVCLMNKGMGTPFISGLILRPLKNTLYPEATASQSLVLTNSNRFVLGPQENSIIRYPLDPYDRVWSTYWSKYGAILNWTGISSASVVQNYSTDVYDVPSAVMQNAVTVNGSRIDFSWGPSDPSLNATCKYFFVFHFAELQNLSSNAVRQFDIVINGRTWNTKPFTPTFLFTGSLSGVVQGLKSYSVSLVATRNATLPPILNAMEMYLVNPITEVVTDPGDARAIMAIQENSYILKKWMGDPCAPKAIAWRIVKCSYPPAEASRITTVNFSSLRLSGPISTNFGDLKALQYLDLSHNNLSGPIPEILGQLPLLIFLDLSSNDLSGPVPDNLLQKSQNGSLSLRTDNNINQCGSATACGSSGRHKISGALIAAIITPIVVVIAICFIVFCLRRRTLKGKDKRMVTGPEEKSVLLENREFSYRELNRITNNFREKIGSGGFGDVFLGYLDSGNPVAVKLRSESSAQGGKEFLAEVQHLTRIHHKNLVSLMGYCKDKNHLALVYEYMPGGDLQDHLRASTSKPLTWEQRLKIALDAAQGLEYLHTACKPALIHRDVKSRNILLTANLEAKIADFGLTKAFGDSKTHIVTEPAGTMGYLDPQYFRNHQLSEKSDVYSFGVVLLEIITGHPPVMEVGDSEKLHVGEWVHQSLGHGGAIESIVDARMGGDYDASSVWKATGLALQCRHELSRDRRPAMEAVVAQLKESLELESRRDRRRDPGLDGDGLSCHGDDGSALRKKKLGEIQTVAAGPTMR